MMNGSGLLNIFEHIFPVVALRDIPQGEQRAMEAVDIFGSAFSLGGNFFLTAAHVFEGASTDTLFGIGYCDGDMWLAVRLNGKEVISEYDIAVVAARVPSAVALPWGFAELPMLTDVMTAGYPYAFDRDNFVVGVRSFKGHIVAAATLFRFASKPRGYELSFQCPRGLSGAPVLVPEPTPKVRGIVLSNAAWATEKLASREELTTQTPEGQVDRHIVERYDSMAYGVAVQTGSLRNVKVEMLGGSLFEHLQKGGLV